MRIKLRTMTLLCVSKPSYSQAVVLAGRRARRPSCSQAVVFNLPRTEETLGGRSLMLRCDGPVAGLVGLFAGGWGDRDVAVVDGVVVGGA
jgi:hypothetical protein